MASQDQYRQAGVDIEKGNQFVRLISPLVQSTHNSSVLTQIGGFSGMVSLNTGRYNDPVLVSSTDGVGTKLKLAFLMNKHDTIGIDLVGMCVNDIVVTGAKPLFMLDYLSMGELDLDIAQQVISGIVDGCQKAGCALIGGETAEMPSFYPPGEYDLAGFVVGAVNRDEIIDGSQIRVGSALVGLLSSGLHSNGYSLVRRIILDKLKLDLDAMVDDLPRPIGEEVLTPTRIYVEAVLNVRRDFNLLGAAHITGGGLLENVPRVLPASLKAVIRMGSWPIPAIFPFLRKAAGLDETEMMRTFNSGLGMVLVVPADEAEDVVDRLDANNQQAFLVGEVAAREEDQPQVELV